MNSTISGASASIDFAGKGGIYVQADGALLENLDVLNAQNFGVDIDASEHNKNKRAHLPVLGDVKDARAVVTPGRYDIQAYVAEADVWRVATDAEARFVPDDVAEPSRAARLVERASSALEIIDQPMLASTNGGPIAVTEDSGGRMKPRDGLYRFRFVAPVDRQPRTALVQPVPGRLMIEADGVSLIGRFARMVVRIWRGEASLT
ncbi:MAG: hypothetical protein HC788_09045 [Sphingopyxis sp.]|nr:hypothetical protein [Sphingopyxis sp.]